MRLIQNNFLWIPGFKNMLGLNIIDKYYDA